MSNRTLHFWLLAPARREVLLAGKYAAGLIASAVIFGDGALLTFAAMVWLHDPVEVQAYWNAGGMGHVFWNAAATWSVSASSSWISAQESCGRRVYGSRCRISRFAF